jgi:protein-S-isoprenylcysteine O-methyltransferase Ste14
MNLGTVTLAVSALWILSEIVLARICHSAAGSGGNDRSSLRILWSVIAVSIAAGAWISARHWGIFPGALKTIAIIGLALIIAGLAIRWTAILTLKKFFTVDVAISSDHRVISSGLYQYVRHPSYAGALLSFLGLGLVFSSWVSVVVILLPILAAFLYRIRVEETVLLRHFGDEYLRYSAKTSRLLPKIY